MTESTQPYSISYSDRELIVRIDRELLDQERLTEFLDWLLFESIRGRSQATPEEIETLADEVNQAAWDRVKYLFLPDDVSE
ncbi:MAG: hypothetical protein KatS3mg050_0777 [Litorilinea sp.]|nr:MAG: hypothetical protein KatS3mg050_0777 [Litorilinea sp.]